MITGFADRRTRDLLGRDHVKGLSAEVQRAALRKLLIFDAAARIDRKAEHGLEMLLHLDQVKEVAMRNELDEHDGA